MDDYGRMLVVFFGVINPVTKIVMFPALTRQMDAPAQRTAALLATLVAFVILLVFGLTGGAILTFLHVSLASFRIAGGLVLGITALQLVQRGEPTAPAGEGQAPTDILVPLATPLIAGPASIVATVAYAHLYGIAETLMAAGTILVLTFIALVASGSIVERVPPAAISIAARIVGLLLLALAFDLAADGLKDHFFPHQP